MRIRKISSNAIAWWALLVICTITFKAHAQDKHLVYIVSDIRIPFWNILAAGMQHVASALGYSLSVYSVDNQAGKKLELTDVAISNDVQGIILSPTNPSAAVTVLKLADQVSIPVVVLDVGAYTGNLVSYIKSDNYQGIYEPGIILASALEAEDWGKARTKGFFAALKENGIRSVGMLQQSDFSYQETYTHAGTLISKNPDLRANWFQGSNQNLDQAPSLVKRNVFGQRSEG